MNPKGRVFQRIACFGGVYSNHLALAAALKDAHARGTEAVFCLGDIGAFGPHPAKSVDLLQAHGVHCLRGNYDDSVGHGREDCQCGYTDPRDNHFAAISYRYTLAGTPAAQRAWMRGLPDHLRVSLGGLRVHMSHGSPRQMNEFLWESGTSDAFLAWLADEAQADVLLNTHTGLKWHREFGPGRHFVNVGVLGRPENDGTARVWYTLLSAEGGGLKVEFVPVTYDHGALAAEMETEGLPAEFVATIRDGWWTTCLEVLPGRERAKGRF